MNDFQLLGVQYSRLLSTEQRAKAISTASNTNKGMVSVTVGAHGATKALVMSQADFAKFKEGFL